MFDINEPIVKEALKLTEEAVAGSAEKPHAPGAIDQRDRFGMSARSESVADTLKLGHGTPEFSSAAKPSSAEKHSEAPKKRSIAAFADFMRGATDSKWLEERVMEFVSKQYDYILDLESRLATAQSATTAIDPESEAANPVWDLVIQTCAQAWPARTLNWNTSPTELIVDIINERDAARDTALEEAAVLCDGAGGDAGRAAGPKLAARIRALSSTASKEGR